MPVDVFEKCRTIVSFLEEGNEAGARENLIQLLDVIEKSEIQKNFLVNHLIRRVGLYPYIDNETAHWQDRWVCEAFKVNINGKEVILHREQSSVLKRLIEGKNIIVSAPTSFGKSFIVDAFIAIKNPKNVVIIVPTIALTDEIRRRLYKKFSNRYKIITTPDVQLGDNNILVFPQERAMHYVNMLDHIDILIVDEFYKADPQHDKDRSPALLRAILHFQRNSKQRYYLAPNITKINTDTFTQEMEFVLVDFSTVFLRIHDHSKAIDGDERKKSEALINILRNHPGKTLIYAGTYAAIDAVEVLIRDNTREVNNRNLVLFKDWLAVNYAPTWNLIGLIARGVGIHNGRLHRSLSQLQIKLFEEKNGLNIIISTSSIIEGVNTSAQNVILWSNKNGQSKLKDFAYRNIIGRAGRMFKHFIGEIFILDTPPSSSSNCLQLDFPDSLIGEPSYIIDSVRPSLTNHQIAKIISHEKEMRELVGSGFEDIQGGNGIATSDWEKVREVAAKMHNNRAFWKGIGYLNSNNPDEWSPVLMQALNAGRPATGKDYRIVIAFIQVISKNWRKTIPQLLCDLEQYGIGIKDFFDLERKVSHTVGSLLSDINILHKHLFGKEHTDISPFITKISNVFLPPVVYDLEEFGLPRMLTRKIHDAKLIDFENEALNLEYSLAILKKLGTEKIVKTISSPHAFDEYILEYFFDGLKSD